MKRPLEPNEIGPELDAEAARFWRGLVLGVPLSLLLWALTVFIAWSLIA